MDIIVRAGACAVIGSILALLLKKYTPEMSLSVAILTGALILYLTSSVGATVAETLRDLAEQSDIPPIYVYPVLKSVAIGMISHLAAQICRDAQQGSVASAVELCAAFCALFVSLPLLESLLSMVAQLL